MDTGKPSQRFFLPLCLHEFPQSRLGELKIKKKNEKCKRNQPVINYTIYSILLEFLNIVCVVVVFTPAEYNETQSLRLLNQSEILQESLRKWNQSL